MALTINNSNKITGLASGLETDTIIEGLMKQYQLKVDKQAQKTIKLEWTADAYREINNLIKNFRSEYLSVLSSNNMMTTSAYSNFTVSMLTTNGAVSVSASSSAVAGEYTIQSIDQLATAAAVESREVFVGAKYDSETKLSELQLENMLQFEEVENEDGEIEKVLSFSINGKTFTFNEDTTIGEMMRKVNSSGAGVTMRFSSLKKGFSLTTDKTGSDSQINIVNLKGNAFSTADSAFGIAEGLYTGQDAICTIEGMTVTQSTNSFTFDGITYNLTAESDTPIKFRVDQDYEKTADNIVKFIDAYNELIDKLQGKLSEKVYRNYAPLTDAQKKEMKEDEIKKWEEYAKSGTLHNDPYIRTLLTELRSAFLSKPEGVNKSLYDIGISTKSWSEGAKIKVDRDKLITALKEDPESVKQLFASTDTEGGPGLMVRVSNSLLNYTKNTTDIALDSLDDRITKAKEVSKSLTAKMEQKEKDLWRKYSEMESALARLNGIYGWISTLFAG
ncbi:MAG: flagellar filament capping protein FliD [Christensenellales bacterium]|jgi:flagellar hook-associated protein 2